MHTGGFLYYSISLFRTVPKIWTIASIQGLMLLSGKALSFFKCFTVDGSLSVKNKIPKLYEGKSDH